MTAKQISNRGLINDSELVTVRTMKIKRKSNGMVVMLRFVKGKVQSAK